MFGLSDVHLSYYDICLLLFSIHDNLTMLHISTFRDRKVLNNSDPHMYML